MQTISCPSCGGPVVFRSAASVMTVCSYCQSTLLKDADSVKDIGKVSAVLEDYSPLQITSSGIFEGLNFSVVGRIQLRYEAGFWNEWHVLFDDGNSGWLSDASGQYTLTFPRPAPQAALPAFEALKPGLCYRYEAADFFAADIRTARCIAWEGELPFRVMQDWEAKVADFRCANRFLTLDYSDGPTPQIFVGPGVTLTHLRCQLLRSGESMANTSGQFKGKTVALDCPGCGGAIQYLAGMAFHIVCPSCQAQVDCSDGKAQVLQKADEIARVTTTVALGDVATINGDKYETIGLMQCRSGDEEDSSIWVEYLLFNTGKGFLWLVESSERWDQVEVLNEWPGQSSSGLAELKGEKFSKLEEYDAEVIYAIGTFNWRVSVGDQNHIVDFQNGKRKLSAESNDKEIVWTASREVSATQIKQWFGKASAADAAAAEKAAETPALSYRAAIVFSVILAVLNIPISFASGMHGLKLIFWALVILWVPVLVVRFLGKKG